MPRLFIRKVKSLSISINLLPVFIWEFIKIKKKSLPGLSDSGKLNCRLSSGSIIGILLYSFLIFLFFAIVAAFSAANDQEFVRGVLGNDYVEMTEQNIAKGDPFGVYKGQDSLSMFLWIAVHNVQVSFMIFITGDTGRYWVRYGYFSIME